MKKIHDIESFMTKIEIDPDTNCWNFLGFIEKSGYGQISYKDKTIRAHKLSFMLFKGEIDSRLVICHSCNNRKCCNPDHLRLDTHKSNSLDMVNAGNQSLQKLNIEQVKEIKQRLLNWYPGLNTELAKQYNVNSRTISGIKTGKRWAHISIT